MKITYKNPKSRLDPPSRPGDAGHDIFCGDRLILQAHSDYVVDTGVSVRIPDGYFGRIFARSGLSVRNKVEVGAGVVDAGYTGSLKVHLYNHSNEAVVIPPNKAIAQLVIIPFHTEELEVVDSLDETERGERGFGSTDSGDGISKSD